MNVFFKNISIVFLLLCSYSLKSQENAGYWYNQLGTNDNKSAVISSYRTSIAFELSKENNLPIVVVTDIVRIVPLKSNYIQRRWYTNSHKRIEKFKIRTAEGNRRVKPVVGDYNEQGIFQTDSKFYDFSLAVNPKDKFVEFTLVQVYDDLRYYVREFIADGSLFTKEREIEILVPDWLGIEFVEFNFDGFKIDKSENILEEGIRKISYKTEDISGPVYSDFFPGLAHESPHLLFFYNRYKPENKEWIGILEDLGDLYSWYKKMIGSSPRLKEKFTPLVKQIVKNDKTPRDSIRSIFYWVQKNIRYIAFEKGLDGFRPQKADLVYDTKFGDCKGMSNLLKELLLTAGFDARLAWLGTRDLPYTYSKPSIAIDNHMICALLLNGKTVFLDPTEKFIRLGDCAERIQGKEVLIEDGESYLVEMIPNGKLEDSFKNYFVDLELEEQNLKGQLSFELSGESLRTFYQMMSIQKITDQEKIIKYFLSGDSYVKIDSIQTFPISFNRDSNLIMQTNISKSDAIMEFGDEIYIGISEMTPYFNPSIDSLKSNKVYFQKSINENVRVEFAIPENTIVKSIPKSIEADFEGFSYQSGYELNNNKIVFTSNLKILNRIYSHTEIGDLLKLFQKQNQSRKQKIILKIKS